MRGRGEGKKEEGGKYEATKGGGRGGLERGRN